MESIDRLINIFRKFPTVGSRTAGRFTYYLMKLPNDRIDELINAIKELKSKIKLCQLCFNPFDDDNVLCPICRNTQRNKNLLCIIEKETDLLSIESTKKFNGLYFILGGTVGTMRKEDINLLRIEELKKRVSHLSAQAGNNPTEIIVALNPTPEGRTTSVLVEQNIKKAVPSPNFKITHLARGIPVGGELEYIDEETLESALEERK